MIKVSIITPTTQDRERFNNRIMKVVDSQDYPNREHIMLYGPESIGWKRNKCIEISKGEIIIMIDSDDIIMPDYVSKCVTQLESCDTTGLSKAYFSDGVRSWIYEYKGKQPYVIGSSMAFWKKVWERNKFPDKSNGEDAAFCANAGIIKPLDYLEGFVAQIHNSNTESHKALHLMKRTELPKPLLEAIQSY